MKVLITDPYDAEAVEKMRSAGLDVVTKTGMNKEEFIDAIKDVDVICVRSATKLTEELLRAATRLKLIVRGGVGLDNIDVEAAKTLGIEVRNTPAATTVSVAEHTIALMLAVSRKIPQAHSSLKKGRWDRKHFKGSELYGKTLGLVGMGRIGSEVALRAKAFGMRVIAYDPYIAPESAIKVDVELKSSLDDVLAVSDYISLHLPLTPETENLLDLERIGKLKKGAYVVNCARGGIVDETALANAIKMGNIAGAAFDVFETEPPINRALLELDEVVCVPHIGANTFEGQKRAGLEVANIVIEFANSM